MEESMSRLCFDLDQSSFFCDGPSYLILSHSLGGCSFEEFLPGSLPGQHSRSQSLDAAGGVLAPRVSGGIVCSTMP